MGMHILVLNDVKRVARKVLARKVSHGSHYLSSRCGCHFFPIIDDSILLTDIIEATVYLLKT